MSIVLFVLIGKIVKIKILEIDRSKVDAHTLLGMYTLTLRVILTLTDRIFYVLTDRILPVSLNRHLTRHCKNGP